MGAHQPRRLTRRQFLGGALAGAAAACLSACRRGGATLWPSARAIPGELLGPDRALGHRLREGGIAPATGEPERTAVVIVGGGAAGLSAGWKLLRSGLSDFALLDLEPRAGGNAAWGENAVSAYPWGAHYLPVPGPEARAVRELLAELKVSVGEERGRPVYDERVLCHAPEERLFLHGRWQEGLFPRAEAAREDLAQHARFQAEMAAFRGRRDKNGLRAFAIPMERSSREAELLALDELSMEAWLKRRGYTSPLLRWWIEYGCRDDFGGGLAEVSAWAGIHYFAARGSGDDDRFLVWPEGNGFLVRNLAAALGRRVRPRCLAYDIAAEHDGVRVDYYDAAAGVTRRLRARAAIVCAPRFVARRIVASLRDDAPRERPEPSGFVYAPWMTANLTVEDPPPGLGAAPAWDNVLFDSEGLGYVDATHQSLSLDRRRQVWTYYRPLIGDPEGQRRRAFARGLDEWRELCLSDLERALPGLRGHVSRLDAWVWGHGMVLPRPGFVWGAERRAAARPIGPVHFAHSDLSGYSVFEEANFRGVAAAEAVLARLGAPHRSSL